MADYVFTPWHGCKKTFYNYKLVLACSRFRFYVQSVLFIYIVHHGGNTKMDS